MESFNLSYYANHVQFIEFLALNLDKLEAMDNGEINTFSVTKEALHRDLASRAYYTAFLKIRDTLNLPQETMHASIKEKLTKEYKNIFLELKEIRTKADYYTRDVDQFVFPVKLNKGTQFYSMRVVSIMKKILDADFNKLTP